MHLLRTVRYCENAPEIGCSLTVSPMCGHGIRNEEPTDINGCYGVYGLSKMGSLSLYGSCLMV